MGQITKADIGKHVARADGTTVIVEDVHESEIKCLNFFTAVGFVDDEDEPMRFKCDEWTPIANIVEALTPSEATREAYEHRFGMSFKCPWKRPPLNGEDCSVLVSWGIIQSIMRRIMQRGGGHV